MSCVWFKTNGSPPKCPLLEGTILAHVEAAANSSNAAQPDSLPNQDNSDRGSTRTRSQSRAAATARHAVSDRVVSHPIRSASQGVSAGESMPPRLLPKFIVPPAIPLRSPESCVIVAQKGPSVQSTSTVHVVSAATANSGLGVRAPIARKMAAAQRAASGTLRRPQVAPQRITAQSEKTPPSGMANIVAIQGSAVKLAARSTSK